VGTVGVVHDDELFEAVSAQRRRLVATLDQLDDDEWNASTLCEDWRVRDVVAHLITVLDTPIWTTMVNLVRYRGFDNWADRAARELGGSPPDELLDRFRGHVDTRFAPPAIGPIAPLTDALVHTRDIERPLGIAPTLDPAALAVALEWVCGGRARGFIPASRISGLRFVAADVDWVSGEGAEVRSLGEVILLAVCDRPQVLGELEGHGAATLSTRLA
jgi:uncharacterized protein (TIGR03083 family)